MKGGAWLFLGLAGFFLVTGGIYAFTADDATGTAVLVFSLLMCALVAVYLGVSARRSQLPADEDQAEPGGSAGVIGFFSPFSYWPAAIAVGVGLLLLGTVVSLWLLLVGGFVVAATVIGLVFQHEPAAGPGLDRPPGATVPGAGHAAGDQPGVEPAAAEHRPGGEDRGGRP